MDLCAGLLTLALVLAVVAFIGHGIWVLTASVYRFLSQSTHGFAPPEGRRLCPGCGCPFPRHAERCPECGLVFGGGTASELRQLERTVAYLQELVEKGTLPRELGEQVYKQLEAHQQKLIAGKRPADRHAPAQAEQRPGSAPAWQMLEELLARCADVRQLPVEKRKSALDAYRRLDPRDEAKLSAAALLTMARLLRVAGLGSRALHTYRQLLLTYVHSQEARNGALEAGQFALREGKKDEAAWFLRKALGFTLPDHERLEIEAIMQTIDRDVAPERAASAPAAAIPVRAVEPILATVAVPVPEPAPPAEPPRSVGQMLAGFMEERNILWGELVGGLLIVGCSIALVISLWNTLERIPYFPFFVFAALTAALYGAGLYTLNHWKLEATSRGLLVIASLLTPLNFLILAGLWRGQEASWLDWLTESAGIVLFTFMVWRSGQVLVGPLESTARASGVWRAERLLTVGVVGAAGSQLLVPHLVDRAAPEAGPFGLVSFAPVLFFAISLVPVLLRLSRRQRVEAASANALFLFLGQGAFAVAVALGFLVYWTHDVRLTLLNLALPAAVAGMPLLITGSLIHRLLEKEAGSRIRENAGERPTPTRILTNPAMETFGLSLGLVRWIGTSVGLLGMTIMLAALIPSWPRPTTVIRIGLLNFAVLVAAALRYRLPYLHVAGILCLAIALVTGQARLIGILPEGAMLTFSMATSPAIGVGLVFLAALLMFGSEALLRLGRRLDGVIYSAGGAALASLAMLLVLAEGDEMPARGMLVFGLCGVGTLLANLRWRILGITHVGSTALLAACVYGVLWFTGDPLAPHVVCQALLAQATLATVLYLLLGSVKALPAFVRTVYLEPFQLASMLSSTAAVGALLLSIQWDWLLPAAGCAFWIVAIWLVISWKEIWPGWFAGVQATVMMGTLLGVSAWLRQQPWVHRPEDLLHLWSVQTYLLGLGWLSLFWAVVRRWAFALADSKAVDRGDEATPPLSPRLALLEPGWPTVDMATLGLVLFAQLAQALYFPIPGFVQMPDPQLGMATALVIVLASALVLGLWERRCRLAMLGLLVLGLTPPVLWAHTFLDDNAAIPAFCWGLSLYFLAASILVWRRDWLLAQARRLGVPWPADFQGGRWSRVTLIAGAVVPVLIVSLVYAVMGLAGWPGPAAASIFARLGWVATLVLPPALIAVGMLGHGVRENRAGYIFSCGLLLQLTLVFGETLGVVKAGIGYDQAEAVFTLQLGLAFASAWVLGWLGCGRWRNPGLMRTQMVLALVPYLCFLVPTVAVLLLDPSAVMPEFVMQTGKVAGWIAVLLATAACLSLSRSAWQGSTVHVLAASGMILGIMAACAVAGFDQRDWLSYHVLTLAETLLGLALLAGSWIGSNVPQTEETPAWSWANRRQCLVHLLKRWLPGLPTRIWVDMVSFAVVLLALRGAWQDPSRPYWSSCTTLGVALLLGAQAVWVRRPAYVYASGLLLNLVGYLAWQAWIVDQIGVHVWILAGPDVFDRFLFIQILCLAIASLTWSLIDWRLRLRVPPVDLRAGVLPFPHLAVIVAVHLLALIVLTALGSDLVGMGVHLDWTMAWPACLATFLAVLVCLWDAEASLCGLPAAPLYLLGMLALGLGLHLAALPPRMLCWAGTLGLAAYALLANLWIRVGLAMSEVWQKLRVPNRAQSMLAGWYWPAQGLIVALAVGLSVWIALDFAALQDRLAGPLAVGLLALGGMVAVAGRYDTTYGQGRPSHDLPARLVVLGLGALAGVELGWALLDPDIVAPWLHRSVTALAALTIFTAVYALGRVPGGVRWRAAARRLGRALAAVWGVLFVAIFIQEFYWFDAAEERTVLALPGVIFMAALLAGMIVAGIWLAVSARKPLSLTEKGRVQCVWAAEMLVVVLLVHLRLTVPYLLPVFLRHNWAFVLMTLGFIGVGLGELFQRRGLPMLAQPLRQTGIFLPLLPLATYLLRPLADLHRLEQAIPGLQPLIRDLDRLPASYRVHALLWFLLAMLYGTVALLRRGSTFALLGALAANFGLWVIYANHESLAFLLHPQIWLIPLGLIVLAAEHLNRHRLTAEQAAGIRYLGLLLIYVSSTADMFITGLGKSVVLPVVLALLAVAGVLAGIMLRVRAFLFQGVTFLFLVVFSQIWYAAVDLDHTWVWWVSGIVLGAAILALFALFEKRRNELLAMLAQIKSWR